MGTKKKPTTKKPTTKHVKPVATSYKIGDDLFLVHQVHGLDVTPAPGNVNHIAVIDCSGSMYGDLPRIREQLKKRIPKLLAEGDTLSVIWFSGKQQAGVLLEAEPVSTLKDLADVNKAIDRWLHPIGLTGFVDPLIHAEHLIKKISKTNGNPFALFFMTDGCDNQWDRTTILKAVQSTAAGLASATFVEYGYYADRPLLTQMAAKAGGSLIHAEDFDQYEPLFEDEIKRKISTSKRVEIKIDGDPIGGFAFALREDGNDVTSSQLLTFEVVGGKTTVPEGAELLYLSPRPIGNLSALDVGNAAANADKSSLILSWSYAALALYAQRMQPKVVYPILKALGDSMFIDEFSTCFGKQRYSEFVRDTTTAAFNASARFLRGYDPSRVPPDDAFTVLDLLDLLASDDSTRILLDHPEFKYSRVSRKRVTADENLSGDEAEALEGLRAQLGAVGRDAKKAKEIQAKIDELLAAKRDALKFVADPAPEGYAISNLTYNEDRANISLLVKKTGTVDLAQRAVADVAKLDKVPLKFQTHIWRNYTIVKDGLVNISMLPVRMTRDLYHRISRAWTLSKINVETMGDDGVTAVINVGALPIINRKMIKDTSAKALAELEWKLVNARCRQKVFKWYLDDMFPGVKLKSFVELYGEDGAAWLKEQGITSNGFSPKMVQAVSTDYYVSKELAVSIKGYASIPSVNEVTKRVEAGKTLTGCAEIMGRTMLDVEAFLKSNPPATHEKWLKGQADVAIATTRGLIHQATMMKFSILVGQTWFSEFKSLDENTIELDGRTAKFDLKEVQINI